VVCAATAYLKSVNLDQLLILYNSLLCQELMNVLALVTLQLDNLSKFYILHDSAVTAKLFLESLQHFLVIETFRDPLPPESYCYKNP